MSQATLSPASQHLRAPRGSGGVLIQPSLSLVEEALTYNKACMYSADIWDEPVCDLAIQAREHLLATALQYTRGYRDAWWCDDQVIGKRLILSGHQPELFHPGVWFKNFALSALAAAHDGIGIQLIVDNDLSRRHTVGVPAGELSQPHIEHVEFDAPGEAIPYEERTIVEHHVFDSFADRVAATIRPLIDDPFVAEFWPVVRQMAEQNGNLGQAIAAARHTIEGQWGLQTLEVPLSRMCESGTFRRFLLHIARNLPRFHEIHNQALAKYRQEFHVRSRTHPVPELRTQNEWYEAPFWVWHAEDPTRTALWIRSTGNTLRWRCGDSQQADGSWELGDPQQAVEQLAQLSEQGYRFRPRALMTTMYARLFLSDLFIHGIGGAKYDILTDRIIEQFLGGPAPTYYTVSATLQLPLPLKPLQHDDLRQLKGTLRDMWYHPERHLDLVSRQTDTNVDELVSRKENLVMSDPATIRMKTRHRELEKVTGQMRDLIREARDQLELQRATLQKRIRDQSLLTSREFSFCLFPAETLRNSFLRWEHGI